MWRTLPRALSFSLFMYSVVASIASASRLSGELRAPYSACSRSPGNCGWERESRQVDVPGNKFAVDGDRLGKGLFRLSLLTQFDIEHAKVAVCIRVVRIILDRFVEALLGFLVISDGKRIDAFVELFLSFRGSSIPSRRQ